MEGIVQLFSEGDAIRTVCVGILLPPVIQTAAHTHSILCSLQGPTPPASVRGNAGLFSVKLTYPETYDYRALK